MVNTHKKLLIAVADTPSSRHAGGQGIALAASMGASAIGISVCPGFEGNMYRLYTRDMRENIEEPHRKVLNELKEQASRAGVTYRSVMPEGHAFEAIVDEAEAQCADLIVIGGVSRSRIERSLLGTTVERVIGYAHRDVLVIPEGSEVSFNNIVLATDGSRYSEKAAERAVALARAYGGSINAIFAIDVPSDYYLWDKVMDDMTNTGRAALEHITDLGNAADVPVTTAVHNGDATELILEEADTCNAGLIVLGSHGRTGLRRLMMGSVAAGVLRSNKRPVLVVP